MNKIKSRSQTATNLKMFFSSLARRVSGIASFIAAVALAGAVHGAAIADFGTTDPTQGANDVAQLTAGTADDTGGNYFADKSSPPGQTFTTGSNPAGYGLTALYVKTGGYNANSTGTAQTYTLRIYSVSGSTATLISTYVTDNLLGFTDGDWLKYSGLTNILQPNTVYAYTHKCSSGWDALSAVISSGPNLYPGGQACNIPTAGGAIAFGSSGNMDGTFLANLSPITDPFVFQTYVNPASAIGGNSVVISAGIPSGTQPIYYQWQFAGTNGIAAKIPNATNVSYTIASVQMTNAGTYSLIVSNNPGGIHTVITNAPATLAVRNAYTISTIGTTAPTPGTYDIAQLTTATQTPGSQDGLNYYSDNATPPGQTFTTGANPAGYTLTAIYVKTGGFDGGQTGTAKTYTLRLYSISGSTATLISTHLTDNTVGFTDGDWLEYNGMTNVFQPNTVYAYTHRQNGNGYDGMGAVLGNVYTGGQACLIPQAGGAIAFSTDGNLDASFQISLVPNGFPVIQNVSISPPNNGGNPVYVPTPVSLSVTATGNTPLHYDWQTDGGLGGAFSDLPNPNTNSYAIDTTSMSPGNYRYQVIVTNVNSAVTSSVVTLNLAAASAPVIVTDTAITPAATFAGGTVTMSATFNGSMPITYQWKFDNGSGAVAIAGATNTSCSIGSTQVTNSGSYYLTAVNAISPFTTSSTPLPLLVGAQSQANTTSAGIIELGNTGPTPGTYDISQLTTTAPTVVAGINYFVNNGAPPGQTFTTLAAAPNGYLLSSIYLQEELSSDAGSGGLTNATYTLGIYSVSGTNAALITSYRSTNQLTITDTTGNDWIQWTGLTNVLSTNATYAFSIHKETGTGWWGLGNDYGSVDLYGDGQAAVLPAGGIGAMAFSTDLNGIDAGFLVALTPASAVVTPPHIGTAKVAGGNFVLSGSGGMPGTGYSVLSQTNVAKPLATWTVAGTGTFNGSGNFSFTNALTPGTSKLFYRIRVP